jgi:hypothetical protein
MENHLEGPNLFPKWDKTKRLMHTYAIEVLDKKVRTRGNTSVATKRVDKLAKKLHLMQLNHLYRANTRKYWEQYCKALNIVVAKDMAMHKEATETKWTQMAGKPNKDFLAKPNKRMGNTMIDNIKNKWDLLRTDDINIILQNFVVYYTK